MISEAPISALPLLAILALVLAGLAALILQPWWVARRHARLLSRPFPAAWRRILRQRVPAAAALPADLQQRLKQRIQVFLAEKPFIGCAGQTITDEVRVTIAAQACLLLLGQPRPDGYPRLREILVYPDAFVVDELRRAAGGVVQPQRQVLAGQSWTQGRVILAWTEVVTGAADPGDGRNVVIHEFAHQLDQESGPANGAPFLGRRDRYARWAAVLGSEFAALQQRLARGETGLIEAYAATDAAEFFAVVSELFFERSAELAAQHPALYEELARYYCAQPLHW